MNEIKNLKPTRKSMFKQGYIDTNKCKKLFEGCKGKPVIYRSSWEKIFVGWCESNKSVKHWGSECISFKYINELDKKEHTYYPDFVLEMVDGTKVVVEIKPYSQTQKPGPYANQWEIATYVRNMSKWKTVRRWCEMQENTKFWIITEKTIHRLKY